MINPTTTRFSSPDHDAFYDDGVTPKVTQYRLIVVPTNDPNQSPDVNVIVSKSTPVHFSGNQYDLALGTMLDTLPLDYFGYIFIRAENPAQVGAYGSGGSFLRGTSPATVDVLSVN